MSQLVQINFGRLIGDITALRRESCRQCKGTGHLGPQFVPGKQEAYEAARAKAEEAVAKGDSEELLSKLRSQAVDARNQVGQKYEPLCGFCRGSGGREADPAWTALGRDKLERVEATMAELIDQKNHSQSWLWNMEVTKVAEDLNKLLKLAYEWRIAFPPPPQVPGQAAGDLGAALTERWQRISNLVVEWIKESTGG